MSCRGYPEIEKFISKEAPKYAPALKVSMRYNYPPQLVLRAKGVPTATTHIANWNVATIKAFLDQKLEQPAAAGEAAGKAAAAPSSS